MEYKFEKLATKLNKVEKLTRQECISFITRRIAFDEEKSLFDADITSSFGSIRTMSVAITKISRKRILGIHVYYQGFGYYNLNDCDTQTLLKIATALK